MSFEVLEVDKTEEMSTPTLPSTWSPTTCPASTDLWEIYVTTSAVFFLLGPLTATSECAPSSYTPTIPYYAASCPTGYTSACAHGLDDATTVCCPTLAPLVLFLRTGLTIILALARAR